MSEEKLKFSVSYGRVVQLRPYETLRMNVMVEHYRDDLPVSWAFAEAKAHIDAELKKLGPVKVVASG